MLLTPINAATSGPAIPYGLAIDLRAAGTPPLKAATIWLVLSLALVGGLGCSSTPPEAPKASEAPMEKWLGALQAGEIPGVLQGLTRASREHWDQESLGEALAKRRQLMGGASERFRIQSVSENDKESRVHVIWTRQGGGHGARYRESYVLLNEKGDWKVVLSANWYGQ